MNKLRIFKETILPEVLHPSSLYFITDTENANYVELYITDKNGANTRRIPTKTDIAAMIQEAIQNIGTAQPREFNLLVVDSITERDTLTLDEITMVFVVDATGDDTVNVGSATYLYRPEQDWVKISEYESMDLILSWNNILNKPNSTPAQIDQAVTDSHTHANKSILDKISQNEFGDMTYNGSLLPNKLDTENW